MSFNDAFPAVYVSFALTKRGKRTLKFAGDLARLLDRDLVALVNVNEARDAFAREVGMSSGEEAMLVRETVIGLSGVIASRVRVEESSAPIPKGSIRVTSDSKSWEPNPAEMTFFGADETGLFARGKGPLYVPIGDKWTHPVAISEAVELAKKFGVGIVLYHSTWKMRSVDSDDPRDHVNGDALKVLSAAVKIARDAGVQVEVAIEHAPTIVDGVLRHAIENGGSAIVMTKSARARRGSYVDQVVAHSPMPVFVMPLSKERGNVADLPHAAAPLPFFKKKSKPQPPKNVAYLMMAGVFLMYLVEIVSKIQVGSYLNSPVITGDGWHNVADLFEVVIVVVTIYLANQPVNSHYPYGWKNLEHLFGIFVGLSLGWAGLNILRTSVCSIIGVPNHATLNMGAKYLPWAVGVMSLAVIMSFVVGRIEVNYGKKYGYPSIVADGEETLSDGRIAVAVLAGIFGEYLLGMPQIEYFLGTIISGFIFHAGWKITINGVKGILQHSIGDEKEVELRNLVMSMRGVLEVVELRTFITGSSAVVDLHIASKVLRSHHLRAAIANRVIEHCMDNGFVGAECHVEFDVVRRPSEDQVLRVAFVAFAHPEDPYLALVASSVAKATHIVVADDEKYSGRRSFIDPVPVDLGAYFRKHHIRKLYVYGSVSVADTKAAEDAGVPISPVSTYCLETLGA